MGERRLEKLEETDALPKSRKLVIYEIKETGTLCIRAMRPADKSRNKKETFTTKDIRYGKAVSGNISDEELGKTVRDILKNCD